MPKPLATCREKIIAKALACMENQIAFPTLDDIAYEFNRNTTYVSRQIGKLTNLGVITFRRVGRSRRYVHEMRLGAREWAAFGWI